MIEVYKIPAGTDPEALRSLQGTQGSYLNPVQDANGNWILSQEEYNNPEFAAYKRLYAAIVEQFELIPWVAPVTVI